MNIDKSNIKREVFPNGLTVLFAKSQRNSIICEMIVKTGAVNETKGIFGISHFVEHLLFEGEGAGLAYGGMYTNTTIAVTIGTAGTPVEIGDTWTAGELLFCTFGAFICQD